MCGILGILGAPGEVDPEQLEALRDRMRHRGPDDAGLYVNEERSVGLAHRRLSILDLSPRGRQPMASADGKLWLVFNGEIYNYRLLRRELEQSGHAFTSETDTEVVLAAYQQWGIGCIHRLRGMFAFGLWDARVRRLWIARDRLGIKPLFYRLDGGMRFASEMKSLTVAPLTLDESAIYDFLTYGYIPAPKTIYRQIHKLEPGCYAVFKDGRMSPERYWDPPLCATLSITQQEAAPLVRQKLAEAVQQHLVADVPVGVMLSGGIDSSSVAALAGRRLSTFSIGFDVAEHCETDFARLVASQLQSDHHERTITREMAAEIRDRIISLYDEPFGDGSAVPTYFVAELARRCVKVALSGEGGDEVFGGYKWYGRWLGGEASRPFPMPGLLRFSTGLRRSLAPLERYAQVLGAFSRSEKKALLHPRLIRQLNGYDDLWHFRRHWRTDLDPLTRLQYLDIKTYLPDDVLTKLDRATMAVGLEGRVPLLDHELVELVFRLPVEVRNPNGQKKFLMKKALAGILPDAILERPKKGFSPPLDSWLPRAQSLDLPDGSRDFFHPRARLPRKAAYGHGLWRVLVLARWLHLHA